MADIFLSASLIIINLTLIANDVNPRFSAFCAGISVAALVVFFIAYGEGE